MDESEGVDADSTYVTKFTYHLSEQYATDLYDSCSEYKTTLCGPGAIIWGCDRDKMYKFLGMFVPTVRLYVSQFLSLYVSSSVSLFKCVCLQVPLRSTFLRST